MNIYSHIHVYTILTNPPPSPRYALTNMVASFLLMSPMLRAERNAHHNTPNAPPPPPAAPASLAILLLEFLHFYGSVFEPAVHALGWGRGRRDEPMVVLGRRQPAGSGAAGGGYDHHPLLFFDPLNARFAFTRYCFTSKLYCGSQSFFYSPSPHLQSLPYCNTIARPLRNICPPTDAPFVCHTPYNIGDGNIV